MNKLKLRSWPAYLLLVLLVFLFAYNFSIIQKERFLRYGTQLVLRLAPVDPRSLMQGDYMTLSFALASPVQSALVDAHRHEADFPRKGRIILTEENGEHVFKRLDDGSPLAPGEAYLEFSSDKAWRLKIGGGSFFFEEGLDGLYNQARFALVRVDKNGKAIIAGLLDKNKRLLSKERWDAENRRLKD